MKKLLQAFFITLALFVVGYGLIAWFMAQPSVTKQIVVFGAFGLFVFAMIMQLVYAGLSVGPRDKAAKARNAKAQRGWRGEVGHED